VFALHLISACTLTREYAGDRKRIETEQTAMASRERSQEQARLEQAREHEQMREHMQAAMEEKEQVLWHERLQAATSGLHEKLRFRTGSSELTEEAREELQKLSSLLMQTPSEKLRLKGYTDSRGAEEINQTLAHARVESVRSALIAQGVNPEQVELVAEGEARPVATNATAAGRAKNRRVEVEVLPPPSG
jgi:outer membrane protein OmpA-like peptidoglycan-associated protein